MTIITISEYAKHTGKSQSTVTKWLNMGAIDDALVYEPGKKKPKIDAEKADKLRSENVPGSVKSSKSEKVKRAKLDDMSFSEARALRESYQAVLAKLKYKMQRGDLVPREQAAKEGDFLARITKSKLTSIPGRLAALVAIESDSFKCEQIMKIEINKILEELATDAANGL